MKNRKDHNRLKKMIYQYLNSCVDYSNKNIDTCESSSRWNESRSITFKINNATLQSSKNFSTESECKCSTEYVCIFHWNAQEKVRIYKVLVNQTDESECRCSFEYVCILHWNEQQDKKESKYAMIDARNVFIKKKLDLDFSTTRRLTRRCIDESQLSDFLKKWIKSERIQLREIISNANMRLKILQLVWTYRDVNAKKLKNISIIDLIIHRVCSRSDLKFYNAKQHRFTSEKKWWYQAIIQKDIEIDMYERIVIVNDRTSQWDAAFVLIFKTNQTKLKFIFNYHFVYEKSDESMMKLAQRTHNLLKRSDHRCYFSVDMKHDYWNVMIHSENRHYLIFHVSNIDQLQSTRMSQRTRTSSFIFIELMNIVLDSIFSSNAESSLLHASKKTTFSDIFFYIDDIFEAQRIFEEQYIFLKNHFFSRVLWSQMRIFLIKLKIEVTKLKALDQLHRIDGILNIKQKFIDKIRNWSVLQNVIAIRNFLEIIQFIRRWMLNFDEIARSLQRICESKIEWRWFESEDLSFQILKRLCFNVMNMFDHDSTLFCEIYIDASAYDENIYINQLQEDENRSILYDCVSFNSAQRNYDIYKRKLFTIVHFTKKYEHIFDSKNRNTIHTNHKSLVKFMNAQKHENIYARWINKLRNHNIQIKYIENKKNQVIDDLSRVIFNKKNCEPDQLVKNLYHEITKHKNDLEWFWKTDKSEYRDTLKRLSAKNEKRKIEKYDEKIIARVNWTSYCVKKQCSLLDPTSYDAKNDSKLHAMIRSLRVESIINERRSNYTQKNWYSDIYVYYALEKSSKNLNKIAMIAFKRKINNYRWDESTNRLLHIHAEKWCICITKAEIASLLQEAHDEIEHFSSNIVLNRIRNRVYWFFMISNVKSYILDCLQCAQWAVIARQVFLHSIQTYQLYDLFDIDFIDWFDLFEHEYKHILNMIDYFVEALFAYSTFEIVAIDVKQVFDYHQISEHSMSAAIYWDADSAFKSIEMKEVLNSRDIICISASNQSHKSVDMIERNNRILKHVINKMRKSDENFLDIFRRALSACNERHITHLEYTLNQILHDIESFNSAIVRSVQLLQLFEKIVLSSLDEMLSLMWNHMTRREKIRRNVIKRISKTKQRMKKRYDREVKFKLFVFDQYVFLRDINLIFDKNVSRWREPFVIADSTNEHESSYHLLKLDDKRASNQFHDDHLRSFFAREEYLRSINEKILSVMKNLRKTRKKIMKKTKQKQIVRKSFEQFIQYNLVAIKHR